MDWTCIFCNFSSICILFDVFSCNLKDHQKCHHTIHQYAVLYSLDELTVTQVVVTTNILSSHFLKMIFCSVWFQVDVYHLKEQLLRNFQWLWKIWFKKTLQQNFQWFWRFWLVILNWITFVLLEIYFQRVIWVHQ